MAWRPRNLNAVPDQRFDRYRERAGRLIRGEEEAGVVFVRLRPWAMSTGGALWWRRWSEPTEAVHEFFLLAGGAFTDSVTMVGDLDEDVRGWDAGRMVLLGETLRVLWLDDAESLRVRDEVFELDPPG